MISLESRVNDLETQLAFQEDTIEALNQLVTKQSEELQNLQRNVRKLNEKMQQLQEHSSDGIDATAHEPPPHY